MNKVLKMFTVKTDKNEIELLAKDSIKAIWTAQELLPGEKIVRVALTDLWFEDKSND